MGYLMVVAALGLSAGLAGCQAKGESPSESKVDQANICEVHDWKGGVTAAACHAQQKIVFLIEHWGNDQLPILFAAVNCDMRYSIAMNNGGVTRIYAGPLATSRPAVASSTSKS